MTTKRPDPENAPNGSTPEQQALYRLITTFMRVGATLFIGFWTLVCLAMALVALGALLGLPRGVQYSGSPLTWTAMLAVALLFAVAGYGFMRLWRSFLDRFQQQVAKQRVLVPARVDDSKTKFTASPSWRMSTSVHLGLQFILPVLFSLAAFGVFLFFISKLEVSKLILGMLFFGTFAIAIITAKLIMWLIPARCPRCGGAASCRGSQPVTFVCRDCKHTHNTGISITAGSGDS